VLFLWGCPPPNNTGNPDGGGTLPGDPPQIALVIPDSNAVGTRLEMRVSVSGCDSVKQLAIYDRQQFIKTVVYTGAPTQIALQPNEVPYNHRMAAELSLVARAWCADGRQNVSAPQGAKFFPVAEVVSSPTGGQVVPDNFYAEGSGANTAFIGCSEDAAGNRSLVKVGITGQVLTANTTLPFPCSSASVFTDKDPKTGIRWMMEPGVGVFAYDSNLSVKSFYSGEVKTLGLGPDGDAIVWEDVLSGTTLKRLPARAQSTSTSVTPIWSHPSVGHVIGTPVANADGSVFIAYAENQIAGATSVTISVERLDYRDGETAGYYRLSTITFGAGDPPPRPPVAFSPSGSILYIPVGLAGGQSRVLACSTSENGCTGTGLKWATTLTFPGGVGLLLPYAGGSRVAAVTAQHVYFLRAENGFLSGTGPVDPAGALVAHAVQPGLGRDFYLLFGPNQLGTLPLEIVALDSAETGEVFRYELLGGSLTVAVGDDGQPWLRVGRNLVRPLPLTEYRLVK